MPSALVTWVVAVPLATFVVYRRVRRNFGRQPLRTGRLAIRSVFLAIVGGVLLLAALAGGNGPTLAGLGLLAGLAGGVGLGIVGVRMTDFETDAGQQWYTPHPGLGLALTALMLGRLAYRFLALRAVPAAATAAAPWANLQRSPLTLAIVGLLIGYYLAYNVGLLRMARRNGASPGHAPLA